MKTKPKRMFPNGLTTVAANSGISPDKLEISMAGREKLTRGVEKKFEWLEEKSYWDHETRTVRTIKVKRESRY